MLCIKTPFNRTWICWFRVIFWFHDFTYMCLYGVPFAFVDSDEPWYVTLALATCALFFFITAG